MSAPELIAMTEIENALSRDETFEENIRIAFITAQNHWLLGVSHMEKEQFQASTAALLQFYGTDSDEGKRLIQECKFINATRFTPSNVPVDYNTLIEAMDENIKPIGLIKIWKETKS